MFYLDFSVVQALLISDSGVGARHSLFLVRNRWSKVPKLATWLWPSTVGSLPPPPSMGDCGLSIRQTTRWAVNQQLALTRSVEALWCLNTALVKDKTWARLEPGWLLNTLPFSVCTPPTAGRACRAETHTASLDPSTLFTVCRTVGHTRHSRRRCLIILFLLKQPFSLFKVCPVCFKRFWLKNCQTKV